ncbi:hypothetical protein IMSAGC005_01244 [Lachnospiraceae bacterium]|nr:hypothetical protein IMSAGC005_01244 [Lachnospiraceae bacterium]
MRINTTHTYKSHGNRQVKNCLGGRKVSTVVIALRHGYVLGRKLFAFGGQRMEGHACT